MPPGARRSGRGSGKARRCAPSVEGSAIRNGIARRWADAREAATDRPAGLAPAAKGDVAKARASGCATPMPLHCPATVFGAGPRPAGTGKGLGVACSPAQRHGRSSSGPGGIRFATDPPGQATLHGPAGAVIRRGLGASVPRTTPREVPNDVRGVGSTTGAVARAPFDNSAPTEGGGGQPPPPPGPPPAALKALGQILFWAFGQSKRFFGACGVSSLRPKAFFGASKNSAPLGPPPPPPPKGALAVAGAAGAPSLCLDSSRRPACKCNAGRTFRF